MHKLGLNFGAVDMILTPDGRYVFLEINPNGQWGWVEDLTGMPISEEIIGLLTQSSKK
jgi:glutathione synthase/RimK-type ligase-like ATP-grasp enzyme